MLGVAADVVRRKNIDNNQRTIYIVVVIVDIILSRKEKEEREEKEIRTIVHILSTEDNSFDILPERSGERIHSNENFIGMYKIKVVG